MRGAGGEYIPTIDPSQIAINYITPGDLGVPTAAMGGPTDPVDIYETNFAPENQRNIFRQAMQKRLDVSFRKSFKITDRYTVQYAFNIFNVTNTTSLDVPQDQTQIRQADPVRMLELRRMRSTGEQLRTRVLCELWADRHQSGRYNGVR